MSTTLTNGLKLPDKGSVDWYADMQNNYAILDGAVGTIAEHTTQIAGKAPLVHTHTKSDITDFPAYGTTAGTICEGNDSRLSDARTPVAHTHGNIANDGKVGTTANKPLITGTGGVVQAGSFGNSANTFCEGNDSRLSDARTPVAHTHTKSDVTDLLNSNFIPSANNSYDLGSSSYQWNNLYAKNYFYNGVAWGLDKSNTWSANQNLKNTAITDHKAVPSADTAIGWRFWSNDSKYWGGIKHSYFTTGISEVQITMSNWTTSGSQGYWHLDFGAAKDFSNVYFRPSANNVVHLGTSTNRWKTLNGVNPGALSLPNIYDSYNVVTTNWSTAYNQPNDLKINGADPSYPGWLFIRLDNCTAADDFVIVRYFHVNATNLTFFGSFIPTASSYVLSVPIQAGITTKVWISKIPTTCKYYACLGTVK